MAAKLRNILVRNGRYYARLAVPKRLHGEVGKKELLRPLGSDRRKAIERRDAVIAEFRTTLKAAERRIGLESKPRRRLMTDAELAHLHYRAELSIDDRFRNQPVEMSEEIVVGFDAKRAMAPEVPMTVRKQNAFVSDTLLRVLRRIASGEAMDDEMAAGVGWVIDDYQARGLIGADLDAFEWRRLARMFASVEIEAWRRREERDRGEPDGAPALPILNRPCSDDLDVEPVSIRAMFSDYIAELARSGAGKGAAKRWKPCFDHLIGFLKHDDASRLTRQDVVRWKDDLLETRAPKTIRDVHMAALRAILKWGVNNGRLKENVANVAVRVPKKKVDREHGFTDAEALTVLKKALAYEPTIRKNAQINEGAHLTAAKRWVPFLCAFTGARVAEMTQLRRCDVFLDAPIAHLRITPEAGSTKTGDFRDVPLHAQLIALGFDEFVRGSGDGPLFYSANGKRKGDTHPSKYVAGRLTTWLRDMNVVPAGVAPNHGWRHRFKTVALTLGIDARIADAIQGHAPRTAGEGYGDVTLEAMNVAISKFPAFLLDSEGSNGEVFDKIGEKSESET